MSTNGDDPLTRLRGIARNFAAVERQLSALRSARDAEIKRVCTAKLASERQAAAAANVSPGYTHRAVVHGAAASSARS